MWTEITSTNQLARLKKDDEILHHPADGGQKIDNPTGKEINSRVYRIQSFEDDLLILYSSSIKNGRAHYSSSGIELKTILNGKWWVRKN